jgi:hypothetical protein
MPFPILTSLYQLLSQLENHPNLKSLKISHCIYDSSTNTSVLRALASQTFPCLRELCIEYFYEQGIDTPSLITILTKNNLVALNLDISRPFPVPETEFFSFSNLIKILPKTNLMKLHLHRASPKEFQELVQILPFTYIRTLKIFTDLNPDTNLLSSQITQNSYLIHESYSRYNREEHYLCFKFADVFLTPTSRLLDFMKYSLYTKTGFSIFKCYAPFPILNKFIQSLKTIITNIKNSPIYSEYQSANTIPNLWLIFNPALFKRLFILLNHEYDDNFTPVETQLIQDNRSTLSKLTPPSLSQFVKLLGYKPSANSPEPPLSLLPNNTWMSFIVPHCIEIDHLHLLSPSVTPTKTAQNSTSR